jgi:regulator of RNase E activity RraA
VKPDSTATLCTALFKRGLRNQFIQDVRPLNPKAGTLVGEAFTLRYIPAREDLNPLSAFQDRARPARSWSSIAARTRVPPRPARSWSRA